MPMKITRKRLSYDGERIVEAVLREAPRPLSAYEIRDQAVAGGERISVPQVYRILTRLVAENRVRRVETLSAYMIGGHRDDAIAVCSNCSATMPAGLGGLRPQLVALIQAHGFAVEGLVVEARGLCARCVGLKGGD